MTSCSDSSLTKERLLWQTVWPYKKRPADPHKPPNGGQTLPSLPLPVYRITSCYCNPTVSQLQSEIVSTSLIKSSIPTSCPATRKTCDTSVKDCCNCRQQNAELESNQSQICCLSARTWARSHGNWVKPCTNETNHSQPLGKRLCPLSYEDNAGSVCLVGVRTCLLNTETDGRKVRHERFWHNFKDQCVCRLLLTGYK